VSATPPLEPMPNLAQRAASSAGWIAIETTLVQGISLLLFAIMARFVSPRDFGLISICFVVLQSSKTLLVDNFASAVIRKSAALTIEYTTAFWITIGFSCMSFAGIEAIAGMVEHLFQAPGLAGVMRHMGVILLAMALGRIHECWMRRHFRFRALAFRSAIGAVVGGAVGLNFALLGYGVQALVIQQVSTSIISLLLLWLSCPWRPEFAFSRIAAIEILRFTLHITPASIVSILTQNCDTVLVGYFFGIESTGIYNMAKRLRLALQLVAAAPVSGVAMPALAETLDDPERLRWFVLRALSITCAICGPVFLGTSAVARDVVLAIFGAHWVAAGPVLAWLAAGGLGAALLSYHDEIFFVCGRPIWSFYISGAYIALAILCFVAGTWLRVNYIAMPFTVPFCLVLPLSAVLTSRLIGLTLAQWARAVASALIGSVAMFVCVRLLSTQLEEIDPLMRLLVVCPCGALIYVGMLAVFGKSTLRIIFALFRSLRKGSAGALRAMPENG
jgi:O-antigen/teichoic acid export membrane protein